MRLAGWAAVAVCALGCGNPIEDGTFRGDVELRLRAVLAAPVLDETRYPLVGVVWLDYDALVERHGPSETSTLPISAFGVGQFTFDVIERPPSVGNYLSAQGQVIPWPIRLGRLVLLADEDANGTFSVCDDGRLAAPDRLLSQAVFLASQTEIVRVAKSDGTLTTVFTVLPEERLSMRMVVDERRLYCVVFGGSVPRVMSVPKDGQGNAVEIGHSLGLKEIFHAPPNDSPGIILGFEQDEHNLFILPASSEILMFPKEPS